MLNSYYSDAFFETKVLPYFCFRVYHIRLEPEYYPFICVEFRRFGASFLV